MNVAKEQPNIVDINAPQSEANTNSGKPGDAGSTDPALQQTPSQQSTQPASDQQQTTPQKPVGTAAAPEEKPVRVAASRPARCGNRAGKTASVCASFLSEPRL